MHMITHGAAGLCISEVQVNGALQSGHAWHNHSCKILTLWVSEWRENFSKAATFNDEALKKVNPERAKNLVAAKAEEILIASLLHNPDFYFKIKDKIDESDFATELNRRIYNVIAGHIEQHRPVEITYFASELSDEEIGYLVRLESMREKLGNTVQECLDCIKRMKDERREREAKNPAGMTDDEWFSQFKKQE